MSATKLFGTDGIRGPLTSPMLLPHNITRLGLILGSMVKNQSYYPNLPIFKSSLVTIGRDTRASGLYLESALVAGITAAGVDCELVGIMPTAAVAYQARRAQAYFGIVISASHNPYQDNGIKLFGPDGFKVPEELEQIIEEEFFKHTIFDNHIAPKPGQVINTPEAYLQQKELLISLFSKKSRSLRLVIDCAHGAASSLAPALFAECGFELRIVGCEPDGQNINRDFGSEAPHRLKSEVLNFQADLGIAFDGDADRVIFADERGDIIDGDALLATLAIHLKQHNLLAKNTLVTTIMSSVALDNALAPHNISVERTQVGDKHVARYMLENNLSFGGENSGHLIMFPLATTGDGILSALKFLEVIYHSARPVSELVSFYQPTPKVLKNILITTKTPLTNLPLTKAAIDQANSKLNNLGRVLLRYSGTENKARLLVEAPTTHECQEIADRIAQEFCSELASIQL